MKRFRPGILVSLVALVLSSHAQTTAGFSLAYSGVHPFSTDHKTTYATLHGISPGLGVIFQNVSMLSIGADLFLPASYSSTQEVNKNTYYGNALDRLSGTQTLHMYAFSLRYIYFFKTSNEFLKLQVGWGGDVHRIKMKYSYPDFDPSYMQFTDATIDTLTMESAKVIANMLASVGANYEFERLRVFVSMDLRFKFYTTINPARRWPILPVWTAGIFVPFNKPE